MKRKSWFSILLLLGTGILLVVTTSWHLGQGQQTGQRFPSAIESCLSSQRLGISLGQPVLVGQVHHQHKTYFLLQMRQIQMPQIESSDRQRWQAIVSQLDSSSKTCATEYAHPVRASIPFSRTVPQAVANQLRLQQLKRSIRGQEQAFREKVNLAIATDSLGDLAPEDLWALQQLGFNINAPHRTPNKK